MNKLKTLVVFLSAACIATFAYIAALPHLYGQPAASSEANFSSPASSSSLPAEAESRKADSSVASAAPKENPSGSSKAVASKEDSSFSSMQPEASSEADKALKASVSSGTSASSSLSSGQSPSSSEEAASADEAAEPVAVDVSPRQLDPGETLVITVSGAHSPESLLVHNDFGFAPRFSPLDENTLVAFLPLSYFTQPGQYTLSVSANDFSEPASFDIEVTNKQFEVQQLTVEESTAEDTIFSDEASKEYRAKIWPLKELYDDTRYFDGRFLLPVEGPVTTQFGMIRYVNGQPNPRHDGVDLSAAAGTPVLCAQNGKVLYADFVKLTGNTVVVEHGYGLKSWYFHMQSLDVAAGDLVKTGDVLGKVGSTGFSTGPHLHFSASINGVYINPFTLVETDLLDTILSALP
jgi:murein DD-endopeptidase MepM/ murein hydrolase activator NlpD